jgi:hypothetical protein
MSGLAWRYYRYRYNSQDETVAWEGSDSQDGPWFTICGCSTRYLSAVNPLFLQNIRRVRGAEGGDL